MCVRVCVCVSRYAYRDQMTGIVVQQLTSNKTTRIRCHDVVKKLAVYKTRLAVSEHWWCAIGKLGHVLCGWVYCMCM